MNSEVISPQEEIIDLKQYVRTINKYKWRICAFAFLVSMLAVVFVLKQTPIYSATATLLIESEQTKAVSFQEIYGIDSSKQEYYLTQHEVLKSNSIARQVIERLNLAEHEDFQAKPSLLNEVKKSIKASLPFLPKKKVTNNLSEEELAEEKMQGLTRAFSKRLSISPIRKTQMVNISFESTDPKLAALVANTVGEVYIESHMAAKMGITQKAAGWLSDRLSDLRIKLDDSESRLQIYRQQENLVDIEGVVSLIQKELEQTSAQLVQAKNEQNKLNSITRIIDEYGRDNIELLESINEITSHRIIQDAKRDLSIVERKHSELSQVYGPKHPKMITVEAELETAQQGLSNRVKSLISGIEKEQRTAAANVSALENELKRIRAEYQLLSAKESEYRKIKREVDTNRNIYDTFLSRSKETEVTSDFNSAIARFTDRAFTPLEPVKPKKSMIVALAFVASFGFGIVLAFVFDALNDTVKSANDIEQKLSQKMLGILPLQSLNKNQSLDTYLFFDKSEKQFAEAVRTFRTGFVLSQIDKKSKVIEVTSTVPSEGKTTIAINLAFSLGQLERVLLIDADMRKPSVCKRFNMPAYQPGLANVIAGTERLDDCIYTDEVSGISVLPCGQLPPNPLELLSSNRFKELLEELKFKFDKIIIDTAPTQAVSDPLVVAQNVDSVIYVVKADNTRQPQIKNGLGRLLETKANIAGVILNQVDMNKSEQYEAFHGYYDYYEYGARKEA